MQGALLPEGDPAVEVLADFAGRAPIPGASALVVDEGGDAVASALADRGIAVTSWRRHAVADRPGAPFPPERTFDLVVLRLPRGREALAMLGHWLAGRLAPTGELWLAGRNDEGIRSAPATLREAFDAVETRETRRHCRILACASPRRSARSDPAAWREEHTVDGRTWVSWPGTFARGRIDDGTALLLAALPALARTGDPFAVTLDLGCGVGLIAAEVARLRPGASLVGVDADALALEAARENVPGMVLRNLDAAHGIGPGAFTAVVSNPPVHQGSRYDRDLASRVLRRAVAALGPGGLLAAVALTGVPLRPILEPLLTGLAVAADDGRYRVWTGWRAR